jgi:histidine triad (HIT) family protein
VTDHSKCIFCRIVHEEVPSFQVCEDELTLTFMDIFPVAPGHSLVIPKEHYENIFEVPPDTLAAIACSSRRLALAIRSELQPEGLGLFQLNGAAAGQTVFHYHQHLIPRSSGETLKLHTRVRGDDDELLAVSVRLARKLAAAL